MKLFSWWHHPSLSDRNDTSTTADRCAAGQKPTGSLNGDLAKKLGSSQGWYYSPALPSWSWCWCWGYEWLNPAVLCFKQGITTTSQNKVKLLHKRKNTSHGLSIGVAHCIARLDVLRVWRCHTYLRLCAYPTSKAITVGDMSDKRDGFGFVKECRDFCMCQGEDCNEGDVVLGVHKHLGHPSCMKAAFQFL